MQVVVAASESEIDAAQRDLRAREAGAVESRPIGRGRWLVYGTYADDTVAEGKAAHLRDTGWPAVTRPEGGGHLAAWQRHNRPVIIDDRLWVCFPWSEFDRDAAPEVVEIEPGLAFGSGGHPSTTLLLRALAARVRGGERVLDVGCGSGVLAIAAARLGAAHVRALDIAPAAVEMTARNARRNGVAARIDVSMAAVGDVAGTFDVVVANIGAATLTALASHVRSRVAPGGWVGLSGLSPAQLSVTAAAYRPLVVEATLTDDDWAAIITRRSG